MNYKISFRERAAAATMQLSKQSPTTLKEAKEQAQRLRKNTKTNIRKQRSS